PCSIDPLLEESLEAPAAHLLQGAHQIARLHDALLVPRQISVHALEEERVAEVPAEQVQDARALLVKVTIEDVYRRLVVLAHDRALVAAAGLAEVRLHIALDAVVVLVASLVRLAIDVLHERREPLVEPRVRPVPAGDQIAEPLVGELVRDE